MDAVRSQRLDLAAVHLSVERALRAISLVPSVWLLAAGVASAGDAPLWCADDEREALRQQAASTFNPTTFVIPKEPTVKGVASGSVDLLVTLDADGAVTSACVLESTPDGVFEQVTVEAVRQWRYAPADVATIASRDRRMKVHVGFAMK
jgi:TonB family protein